MVDIAKCDFKDCDKKGYCFRFTSHASKWQSYVNFKEICDKNTKYEWFYYNMKPIEEKDKEKLFTNLNENAIIRIKKENSLTKGEDNG